MPSESLKEVAHATDIIAHIAKALPDWPLDEGPGSAESKRLRQAASDAIMLLRRAVGQHRERFDQMFGPGWSLRLLGEAAHAAEAINATTHQEGPRTRRERWLETADVMDTARATACQAIALEPEKGNAADSPNNAPAARATDREPWPPDDGWHFRAGQYAYKGKTFDLVGVAWHLLRALAVQSRKYPLSELREISRGDDSMTGEKAMQTHLSLLRKTLRQNHKLPEDADPLPRKGRGADAVYSLDLSNRHQPRKSRIKRKLSARRAGN